MAISSVSINPPPSSSVSSVVSNAAAPFVNDANKSAAERQASTVVTLSAQARQLSQNEAANQASQPNANQAQASNRPDTAATENVETRPKETAEAPGIQFIEGEKKGGRVNVVA